MAAAICCGDPEARRDRWPSSQRTAGRRAWAGRRAAAARRAAARRLAAPPGRSPAGLRAQPVPLHGGEVDLHQLRAGAWHHRRLAAVPGGRPGRGRLAGWGVRCRDGDAEATATVATAVTPGHSQGSILDGLRRRSGGLRCWAGLRCTMAWRRHERSLSVGRARYALGYHPGDTALPAAKRGARAEARGCAAGQGDALREGNHRTRRVLSVIHHAQVRAGGRSGNGQNSRMTYLTEQR